MKTSRRHAGLATVLAFALSACGGPPGGDGIVILCGGSFRPPLEKLAQALESERGMKVVLSFGQSEDLLPKVKLKAQGDVFVTHDPYELYVRDAGALKRSVVVGHVAPVVVVQKGNPKGVKGFADLAKPGLRVALPDPQFSTAGKMVDERLKSEGLKEAVQANVGNALLRGHAEVANAIKTGARDTGIVWNGIAHSWRDALEIVPEPYGYKDTIRVTVMGLNYSKQSAAVEAFLDFAEARGEAIFREFGYVLAGELGVKAGASPAPGASPPPSGAAARKLSLYCAAGVRPAAAEIAEAYRAERGIEVECDYAGSEILLGRLKISRRGDLYMPGESEYLDQAAAAGLVRSRRDVCRWTPVILVAKGNPKGVRTLEDLANKDLKLGLGNPQACAIGRQTVPLLKKNNLDPDAVYSRAVFQSLTVNELGLHVKMGKIDATIVWDATAFYFAEQTEIVEIPADRNLPATVPVAVLTTSEAPEAATAFVEYLTGERAREIFRKHHFTPAEPR
jgi:molybdate transport system substrate-binding protein